MGPPVPLMVVAILLIVAGLLMTGRSLWRAAAAIRARHTRGAPYRAGQIGDRLLGLAMTLPWAPLGVALAALALAQAAFQPTAAGQVVRVGRIDARPAGWGRTAVRLAPDPTYPERRLLEGTIPGARWAVAGTFLHWDPAVRWLGLRSAQRVRALLGSADVSGTSPLADRVVPIDAPPRLAAALLAYARLVPFLTVRRGASSWFAPADRRVVILYATTEGYVTDTAAAGSGGAR